MCSTESIRQKSPSKERLWTLEFIIGYRAAITSILFKLGKEGLQRVRKMLY